MGRRILVSGALLAALALAFLVPSAYASSPSCPSTLSYVASNEPFIIDAFGVTAPATMTESSSYDQSGGPSQVIIAASTSVTDVTVQGQDASGTWHVVGEWTPPSSGVLSVTLYLPPGPIRMTDSGSGAEYIRLTQAGPGPGANVNLTGQDNGCTVTDVDMSALDADIQTIGSSLNGDDGVIVGAILGVFACFVILRYFMP